MLTPRQSGRSRTAAGARNLFLDADPDEHALAPERSEQHRARTSRPRRQRATRARAPHARRVILEPDRRRPGCRHVHPDTPRGRPAGHGGAREASPRGRSRGHAASSAGGPRVRGARGGGSAHGDADLAELAGTRLARDLRCSQRRRATADRCDRDAHTRPDPCRRADRPAQAGFGDRVGAGAGERGGRRILQAARPDRRAQARPRPPRACS